MSEHELRVVVVDDDDTLAGNVAGWVMSNLDILHVFVAGCAEECLAKMSHYQPDIVITDMNMFEMTGRELAEKLRSDGFTGRIVLMTSDSRTLHTRYMDGKPFDGFLDKGDLVYGRQDHWKQIILGQ